MANNDQQCILNIVKNTTEEYIKSGEAIPINIKLAYPGRKGNKSEEANVVLNSVPELINLVTSSLVEQLIERQNVMLKEQSEYYKGELAKRDERIEKLESNVRELQYQADCSLQYSMRSNLKITGVKFEKGEDVKEKFVKIVNDIGIQLSNDDIDTIHRVGTQRNTGNSASGTGVDGDTAAVDNVVEPSITCKFKLRDVRNKVFEARKNLRNQSKYDAVFINDHVTPLRNRILYELRNRDNKTAFKYVWSREGRIFARKPSEVFTDRTKQPKPHTLTRPEDLKPLGWTDEEIQAIIVDKRK